MNEFTKQALTLLKKYSHLTANELAIIERVIEGEGTLEFDNMWRCYDCALYHEWEQLKCPVCGEEKDKK